MQPGSFRFPHLPAVACSSADLNPGLSVFLGLLDHLKSDPAFKNPTKPVGSFYSKEQAEKLIKEEGWAMIEDAGRGWRRVVPSPKPGKIVQRYMIRDLCRQGNIVIALGGGGIPIWRNQNNDYEGIEAVVDKDLASGELAKVIHAELFIILTPVKEVCLDFNKPTQRPVKHMTLKEARHYMAEGQFPAGSMGPKIQAVIDFLEQEDATAIITDSASLKDALDGKAGTRITR